MRRQEALFDEKLVTRDVVVSVEIHTRLVPFCKNGLRRHRSLGTADRRIEVLCFLINFEKEPVVLSQLLREEFKQLCQGVLPVDQVPLDECDFARKHQLLPLLHDSLPNFLGFHRAQGA